MRPSDRTTSFRFRIFLAIAATAAIFLMISLYGHESAVRIVLRTVEDSSSAITAETSTAVEEYLRGAEVFPRVMARAVEQGGLREDQLFLLLQTFVDSPAVYGSAVAFEPYAYDPAIRYFGVYFHETPLGPKKKRLDETYNYPAKAWYRLAKEGGEPAWTEPYFDYGAGETMMCSFVVPMHREAEGKRLFMGAVTADVTLEWLNKTISLAGTLPSSYGFIISRSGRFIVHPKHEFILNKTILDADMIAVDKTYADLGRRMLKGERGFVRLKSYVTGKPSWVYFSPIGSTGWSVGLVTPEEDLLQRIRELDQRLILFGALTVLLLFVILFAVSHSVTKPLAILSAATTKIAGGNIDEPLPPVDGPAEVVSLHACLEQMRRDLKVEMEALAEASARQERINSELRIARNIQTGFLPGIFPQGGAFDVHALLYPAREVGGDMYDFFLLDRDHLFFAVGDVSDKGVPAALFMAATVTTVRALAKKGIGPGEILGRVNRELCRENEELMFVTMLCGIADLRDGGLVLANAGHLSPVLRPVDAPPSVLDVSPGLVLGVQEDTVYADSHIRIPPGAVLILFTDGVTDARAEDGTFLGMEGVLAVMAELSETEPAAVAQVLLDRVERWSTSPADDIAVLALRYNGTGELEGRA